MISLKTIENGYLIIVDHEEFNDSLVHYEGSLEKALKFIKNVSIQGVNNEINSRIE